MKLLDGKKTYIAAALFVVLSGLRSMQYIDENTYQMLVGFAGALGLYGLRKAMN